MNEDQMREILAQEFEKIVPLKTATAAAIRSDSVSSMYDMPYRVVMAAMRRTRDWTVNECKEVVIAALE